MDPSRIPIPTGGEMTLLADLALDVTGDAAGAESGRTSLEDVRALTEAKDATRSPMSIRLGAASRKKNR